MNWWKATVLLLLPTISRGFISCPLFFSSEIVCHSKVLLSKSTVPESSWIEQEHDAGVCLQRKSQVKHVPWSLLPLQTISGYHDLEKISSWSKHEFNKKEYTESSPFTIEESRISQEIIKSPKADITLKTPLRCLYIDDEIIVVHKPSGVLCVPGPRRKPSLANIVFDLFGNQSMNVDKMVAHRLDMDTSGIVVYARTDAALRTLHDAFRDRNVKKTYEALVCGHLDINVHEGEIELPLQRDHVHPPFMRVSTIESEQERCKMLEKAMIQNNIHESHDDSGEIMKCIEDGRLQDRGFQKMMGKNPKQSLTYFRVLKREFYHGKPVTRLLLTPITGRTHQLRVHTAALGFPIISDTIYGINGDGSPYGGLNKYSESSLENQNAIYKIAAEKKRRLCLHARQLSFFHPRTGAPMVFEDKAPF